MPRFFLILTLVTAWAAIYLPGLGGMELKGEEGRRILPARAMMQSGDYVLPFSEGRPYHRKPPLVNWAIAASFQALGGESEFAARLPSALAVLLLALTGAWAGRCLAGPAGAWWLPLLLLTCLGALEKGRLAEIEALFFSLSGIGMLVWLAGWYRGTSVWSRWLHAGCWFGLACLAKGPIFLPFFYAIAVPVLWTSRQRRELWHPAHFAGLALSLLPAVLWASAARQHLAGLTVEPGLPEPGTVWINQIVKRLDPSVINWKTWPLGPPKTFILLCPGALIAAVLWRRTRRVRWPDLTARDQSLILGLGWGILASGLVYALLPESHARFQLPLIAPAALLATVLLTHWKNSQDPGAAEPPGARWFSGIVRGLLLVQTCAGVLLPWFKAPHSMVPAMAVMLGGSAVMWLLAIRFARLPWPERMPAELTLLAAWTMIFKAAVLQPVMRLHEDIRPPALAILAETGPQPRLMALHPGPQPFLFYLGKNTLEIASLKNITEDATHLLLTVERLEMPEMKERLARAGFRTPVLTVKDDDGTPYTLMRRTPLP